MIYSPPARKGREGDIEKYINQCFVSLDYLKLNFKKSRSTDGKLIRPEYVSEHLKILLDKLELRYIRFNDLRHSCASLLLAKGIPMKAIQEWLGHSNFSTFVPTT